MVCRCAQHEAGRLLIISGNHRADQAAAAKFGQFDNLFCVGVRHQGADRPESLHAVWGFASKGVIAIEQGGGEKRAFFRIRPEDFEFPGDTVCWLYKFHVDPHRAFHQRGTPDEPVVYWLDVQAEVQDPETWFGWKSSVDNWNDDAVYGRGFEPYFGPWMELRYPPMHQLAGRSIDLAFRLGYDSVAEVPDRDVPERSGLRQNVPNPFNPRTRIEYVVPEGGGHVRLEIYDMRGRLQRVLVDHFQTGGEQQVFWDGRDGLGRELASGVYFYRLDAGSFGETKRMVLMR